jgi:hypothetical protein
MMRRMRTRLPTYLSTGLGALVDISNTPWDYACSRSKTKAEYASGANTVKSCSEASVRNADNLSNELTGSILGYRNRMRIAVSVCQLVDFRLPQFPPTAEKSHEYAWLRKSASQHFAG